MRAQEEIVEKIKSEQSDFFGTKKSDWISYLEFDNAKEFLKPEVTAEEWKASPTDHDSIKKEMLEYMPFAWDKACNCRGLSASRSMDHYTAWIWMLGDDMAEKFDDLSDYEYYGKDNLATICEEFGWDHSQWDDGIRSNSEY